MRQGILRIASIASACTLLLSCKSRENKAFYESLYTSYENSGIALSRSTDNILYHLQHMQFEPSYAERSAHWYPVAKHIHSITHTTIKGIWEAEKKRSLSDGDISALYSCLAGYKRQAAATDPLLRESFEYSNTPVSLEFGKDKNDSAQFKERYFSGVSSAATKVLLARLRNDIITAENQLIKECMLHCSVIRENFTDYYYPLLTQNTHTLYPGNTLEIKAGIGAYSKAAQPVITINGQKTEPGEEGFSIFRLRVSENPGDFHVPVTLAFFNQTTGRHEELEFQVEYKVLRPCPK